MGLIDFIVPLGLTLVSEGAVAFIWGLRKRDLLLVALVNVLTNPAAVLLHALFPGRIAMAGIELGAVAAEALCYKRLGGNIRGPWFFSLIANVFSFSVGLGIGWLVRIAAV